MALDDMYPDFINIRNISLHFDEITALNNVSMTIKEGEVHAIVGEHGAGKSSLAHILSGIQPPDNGSILVYKQPFKKYGIKESRKKGITIVTQNTHLCEHLSVAKNIYMNRLSSPQNIIFRKRKIYQEINDLLEYYDIHLNIEMKAGELFPADRVLVDILRQLFEQPRLLILDEALEKLTSDKLRKILVGLHKMKRRNMAILFITHRIDDIYRFADRVSVIRHGEILITETVKEIDKFNLIKLAYTQFPGNDKDSSAGKAFYHLLKYNQAILETLPVNLLVVDNDHQVKLINKQAGIFFQTSSSMVYPQGLDLGMLLKSNPAIYRKLVKNLEKKKQTVLYNEPFNNFNGQKITNIASIPIKDGYLYIGSIIMIDDVTEQIKLREQIYFAEKLSSIGILATGVAHEINNPLEIIQNDIDYLLQEPYAQETEKILDEIGEGIQTISQIVGHLTNVSQEVPKNIDTVSINEVVESVLKLVKPYAKKRNTCIEAEILAKPLFICVNKTELRQILLNILKNSFEALQNGGFISITLQEKDHQAELIISDNGPGLPMENPENIFLPFYSTKKGSQNNLGLGLYLSYESIKKNGGEINVFNQEPTGCRFELHFPLQR